MDDPINILHIVLSLEFGGLEKLAIDLSEKLNHGRYRSVICCLDRYGAMASEARDKGIKVVLAKRRPGIDLSLPLRLARILMKERIEIVHTHNPGALIYGTLGAKFAGVPVIINTRHGRAERRVNRLIWNMNDSIVAISKDAKKRLLKYNSVNPDKLKVVYNGIETNQFENGVGVKAKEELLGVDRSCLVIGTVSRLSKEKDQITLLDSFAKVSQELDNVKLVFVGDGRLRSELEEHSEKIGIGNKVIFLGFRQDVAKIMSGLDLFALSSLTEGVSLSLLGAMAAGKPVVATKVGGNPEVAIDRVTGLLVPPKDPDRMAEAMITLLKNRGLANRMGETAKRRVEEQFSLEKMVREYESLYSYWLRKKVQREGINNN